MDFTIDIISNTPSYDFVIGLRIVDFSITVSLVGAAGKNGVGVPTGGSTGQYLSKNSSTDYDTKWTTMPDFVPYTGANKNVSLGSNSITASNVSGINTGDQDLSGLVVKEAGKTLISTSDLSKIHAPHSDDQDLSGLVQKENGKSLVYDSEISKLGLYPSIPEIPNGMYLGDDGTFKSIPTSIGVAGHQLYMSNINSDIPGYKKLSKVPDFSERVKTIVASNSTVYGETYLSDNPIGSVVVDAGAWAFYYLRSVSNSNSESYKMLEVFCRHTNGTETTLFTLTSPSIEDTVLTERSVSYSKQAFVVAPEDRLGVRVAFRTTRTPDTTLSYIIGGSNGWFMRTPMALKHSDLTLPNGDETYWHPTLRQVQISRLESAKYVLSGLDSDITTGLKYRDRVMNRFQFVPSDVFLSVTTAPSSIPIQVDILKNDVSILSSYAQILADTTTSGQPHCPGTPPIFEVGDYISIVVNQIGIGETGKNLILSIMLYKI